MLLFGGRKGNFTGMSNIQRWQLTNQGLSASPVDSSPEGTTTAFRNMPRDPNATKGWEISVDFCFAYISYIL